MSQSLNLDLGNVDVKQQGLRQVLALVFAGIAKRSGAAASEGLEQRLQIVETGAAGDFAAVGEGVAGGEVEELLVDFFEAPMSLEREQAAVAGRLERAEVGGPIDFTETDGRAGGDVRGAGRVGRVADGVFDVEMEEAGSGLVLRRLSTHHAKRAPKTGHALLLLAFSFCQHHRMNV